MGKRRWEKILKSNELVKRTDFLTKLSSLIALYNFFSRLIGRIL